MKQEKKRCRQCRKHKNRKHGFETHPETGKKYRICRTCRRDAK